MKYTRIGNCEFITNDPNVTVTFEDLVCGRTRTLFQGWVRRTNGKAEYQKDVEAKGFPRAP